jgi:beta-lactamase class A
MINLFRYLFIITTITATSANAANIQTNNSKLNQIALTQITALESSFDGKIGVYAINTNNGESIAYRADELFPVQSTLKLIGVAALLKKSDKNLLQQKIHYTKNDLMFWSPITKHYLNQGMTLEALSEAAISYSDNPAMNLIIKKLGGPQVVTDFAHSIGNKSFNIRHYECSLNSNPKNDEDTATPRDMAISVKKITLGNILPKSQKNQLVTWMRNNTTGYTRMRAGTPIGFIVADKTGSGDYGVANDIGIIWQPNCQPIVLAIYTVQNEKSAKGQDSIVAATTKIVLDEFAKNNSCN